MSNKNTSVSEIRNSLTKIMLGGEERVLKYDMNAYAELENKYGSVDAALSSLDKGRITDVRQLLWAGLIHDQAVIDEDTGDVLKYTLTPHTVGGWISDISMLKDVVGKVADAITNGMPEMTEEEVAQAKAEREANTEVKN